MKRSPAMNLRPRLHRSGKSIVRSYAESVGISPMLILITISTKAINCNLLLTVLQAPVESSYEL